MKWLVVPVSVVCLFSMPPAAAGMLPGDLDVPGRGSGRLDLDGPFLERSESAAG